MVVLSKPLARWLPVTQPKGNENCIFGIFSIWGLMPMNNGTEGGARDFSLPVRQGLSAKSDCFVEPPLLHGHPKLAE
jgi:hypothetical protein